jgi:sterol desaturase/sphingolipid hydroxylase (fatty acid hydroxylase superfamily)
MELVNQFVAQFSWQLAALLSWTGLSLSFLTNVVGLLFATALSLLFLVAVFRPLELAFPAKPGQAFFRPRWFTDLCFFLGQYLLWNALVFWCLAHFRNELNQIVPPDFRSAVASQPIWLQMLGVILLSDFCVYWGHRLQHRSSFLWRFHSVHHSTEHLDWLAAHREHPLDTVYTLTLINLPAFVLGFPLETLAGFIAFRGVWAIYIHSNVRLPLGPLRPILGAPELHHWHHDRNRDAGNYGNVCPLMDLIFGTYVCPDHEPEQLGLNYPTPKTWLGHMIQPLLPRWLKAKFAPQGETGDGATGQTESAEGAGVCAVGQGQ